MKKLNVFLMMAIVVLGSVMADRSYAALTYTYPDIKLENMQIGRQFVIDEEGVTTEEIYMAGNYTVYDKANPNVPPLGKNVRYDLTAQQENQVTSFIIPFYQLTATDLDVIPETWAQ